MKKILGIVVAMLVIMAMVSCATPSKSSIGTWASTPAEIIEIVTIGMDRSTVSSLVDNSRFNLIAIQLSKFSEISGKVQMVPREAESELPATHIVHLYIHTDYGPAYVVYSMNPAWEVTSVGRISSENAQWLIDHKNY